MLHPAPPASTQPKHPTPCAAGKSNSSSGHSSSTLCASTTELLGRELQRLAARLRTLVHRKPGAECSLCLGTWCKVDRRLLTLTYQARSCPRLLFGLLVGKPDTASRTPLALTSCKLNEQHPAPACHKHTHLVILRAPVQKQLQRLPCLLFSLLPPARLHMQLRQHQVRLGHVRV